MANRKLKAVELYKNLEFDKKTMDTTLAEDYLKKNGHCFTSYPKTESNIITHDNYYNEIHLAHSFNCDFKAIDSINVTLLRNISIELKKNVDLFAQLEYVIRNIPQDDVKNYDMKLITRQFETVIPKKLINNDDNYLFLGNTIAMSDDHPLCTLGFVAEALSVYSSVNILATRNMAVVSILFATLCVKAGLSKDHINVFLVSEDRNHEINDYFTTSHGLGVTLQPNNPAGAAAVVTEMCDVDSAVDILLSATSNYMYNWRLRRIIIQENVNECFKRCFTYKINLKQDKVVKAKDDIIQLIANATTLYDKTVAEGQNKEVGYDKIYRDIMKHLPAGLDKFICKRNETNNMDLTKLLSKANEAYICGEKILLFDFAGTLEEIPIYLPCILVETYRTTKESLSLIKKYNPNYLSVWCNDTSTSNEIIHGTDVLNVWQNDFGVFESGFGVAETYYKGHELKRKTTDINTIKSELINEIKCEMKEKVNELSKLWHAWVKTDIEKRKSAILIVLEKYMIYEKGNMSDVDCKLVQELMGNIVKFKGISSIFVENGKMCLHLSKHVGMYFYVMDYASMDNIIEVILQSVLNGNGIILGRNFKKDKNAKLFDMFISQGVPIVHYKIDYAKQSEYNYCALSFKELSLISHPQDVLTPEILYKPKTVWASFGETFAN